MTLMPDRCFGEMSKAMSAYENSQNHQRLLERSGRTLPQVSLAEANSAPRPERMAFSVKETAALLGISEKTVRRLVERKLLNPSRALRHLLFSRKEVQRFLDESSAAQI
jgi:excisionase family DNA binding protein